MAQMSEAGSAPARTGAATPSADLAARARSRLDVMGETNLERAVGCNRGTLARVIARLPVRAGTLALVTLKLAELDAAAPAPATADQT